MATDRMNENWARVKSQIEAVWSDHDFGDKEMKKARGNLRDMVNLIHEKTGEPRSEITQKIIAFV
ncbi:MAG: general stress protein CsbD [Bacteroidetes bacterium]|nr:general stress protein CsbD [Bacteroidota bacterium]